MAPSPKQGPQVLGLEETLTAIRLAQPKEAWAEADQVSQRCWSSFEYCQIRGWLAGWLAGWVAGWLGGWLAGWLAVVRIALTVVVSPLWASNKIHHRTAKIHLQLSSLNLFETELVVAILF